MSAGFICRKLHLNDQSVKKRLLPFFQPFFAIPAWIWHQAHQASPAWAIPTDFPSLPPQAAAARLCAAHYPAIPISREEIVNVSGAGDR